MKLWRYYGLHRLVMEEDIAPQPGPGDVVIRVVACGICATDLKTYNRGHALISAGAVLGHEVVGTIAQVGADGSGWQPGERVAVAPYVACGTCYFCQRGRFTLCEHLFDSALEPGGFVEYARVPALLVQHGMHRLPGTVDDAVGTLAEPLACCIHAMDAMALASGCSLLIIGDGPMGLLQAELARTLGVSPIIVSGATPFRLDRAQRAADVILNGPTVNLADEVRRLTGGYGVDAVIVSVPEPRLVQDAMAVVARGGVINLFAGLPSQTELTVEAYRLHYDEVRLFGTFGFGPDDFRRAVEMLGSQAVHVDGIVTKTVPFAELAQAFENASPERSIKSVAVM